MKKYISILVTVCLLLGVSISFAEEENTYTRPREKVRIDRDQIKKDRAEKIKAETEKRDEYKKEMESLISQTRENREKMANLQEQSKQSYKKAKAHIRKLLQEKDSLTEEQLLDLKESLEILKDWNKRIGDTKGDMGKITKKLRDAKQKRDYKILKECYEKINELQSTRIENLNKVIEDLNKITEI